MTTSYTRDRGFTRARRLGRDEEDRSEQLREMLDDPDLDFGDLIAAALASSSSSCNSSWSISLRPRSEDWPCCSRFSLAIRIGQMHRLDV
jgi:hypothetical protein